MGSPVGVGFVQLRIGRQDPVSIISAAALSRRRIFPASSLDRASGRRADGGLFEDLAQCEPNGVPVHDTTMTVGDGCRLIWINGNGRTAIHAAAEGCRCKRRPVGRGRHSADRH
jgi:hypothetical protein